MEKLLKSAPQCYRCGSALKIEELVKEAATLSKGPKFIQIFEYDPKLLDRLLPAYLNAMIRYDEKLMRSREPSKEMLILAAGKMNISKAIEKCGVKDPRDFLLFSTDVALSKNSKRKLGLGKIERITLEFDPKTAGEVAIVPISER